MSDCTDGETEAQSRAELGPESKSADSQPGLSSPLTSRPLDLLPLPRRMVRGWLVMCQVPPVIHLDKFGGGGLAGMTDDPPWGTNQPRGVPGDVAYSSTIRTRLSEASEEPQRGSEGKQGGEGRQRGACLMGSQGKGAGVTWGGACCCSVPTALEEWGAYSLVERDRPERYPFDGWGKVGAKLNGLRGRAA